MPQVRDISLSAYCSSSPALGSASSSLAECVSTIHSSSPFAHRPCQSGVGKSHLINAIFRTKLTVIQQPAVSLTLLTSESQDVEHGRTPGVSDIDKEITSDHNPRLVLHDSQGFSHGHPGNFEIVQDFIQKRSQMALKDRLHAIWFDACSSSPLPYSWSFIRLCTEVPTYDGSLLEFGEERILQLKDRGGESIFGHARISPRVAHSPVPIVAVFTKYDVLVNSLIPVTPATDEDLYGDIMEDMDSAAAGRDNDADSALDAREAPIDPSVLARADEKLRTEMIRPFEGALDIPWVAVSGAHPRPAHRTHTADARAAQCAPTSRARSTSSCRRPRRASTSPCASRGRSRSSRAST